MDRQGTKNQERQPIRLALETETPLKVGQEFKVLATAIVTQGKQALEGQMVQFFQEGGTVGNPAQTDENGRVQHEFTDIPLDTKSVVAEAQLVGGAARARKIILLTEEIKTKKKPFDLEIKSAEKEGVYFVNATISTEDGTGTKGVIRMLTGEGRQDFQTDEQGVIFFELQVTERQKEFRFLVLGTTIDKTLRLSGPKSVKPKYQKPSEEELKKLSLWEAFKSGWQKKKGEK